MRARQKKKKNVKQKIGILRSNTERQEQKSKEKEEEKPLSLILTSNFLSDSGLKIVYFTTSHFNTLFLFVSPLGSHIIISIFFHVSPFKIQSFSLIRFIP